MQATRAARVSGLRASCPYSQTDAPKGKILLPEPEYAAAFPRMMEALLRLRNVPTHFTWPALFAAAERRGPRYHWKLLPLATGAGAAVIRVRRLTLCLEIPVLHKLYMFFYRWLAFFRPVKG